jgi:hypothetical protein
MTTGDRLALWMRLTGLPPPEMRGRQSDPSDTAARFERDMTVRARYRLRKSPKVTVTHAAGPPVYPIRSGGRADPSWRNNSNPWQENAIRAWEDAA